MDEERAISALPNLLQADAADTETALETLRQVVSAVPLKAEGERRFARVESLFGVEPLAQVESPVGVETPAQVESPVEPPKKRKRNG